jgi:carbamoyl-phosphate synthase large subunit
MGLTVIVTGAGGPAGVSVVQALRAAGHRVVAADCDEYAVGFGLADDAAVLPFASDDNFVEALCELAISSGANVLISTLAEELLRLSPRERELTAAGLATWLPAPAAVETCADKWQFAVRLAGSGVPIPATALGSHDGVPGPWIVKPRFGRGSRDVFAVDDESELPWVLGRVPDPIVQTRLDGCEFTVDAMVDRDGSLAGAVARWRLGTTGGISTRGRTFVDPELTVLVGELLREVGLVGPATVQGFRSEDSSIAFTEVNPRFSGGLPLSLHAGADLVGEYVEAILGRAMRPERLTYRPDVVMSRHFAEVYL